MRPVHGGARGPQVDERGQGRDEAGAWWGEGTTVDVRGQGREAGAGRGGAVRGDRRVMWAWA